MNHCRQKGPFRRRWAGTGGSNFQNLALGGGRLKKTNPGASVTAEKFFKACQGGRGRRAQKKALKRGRADHFPRRFSQAAFPPAGRIFWGKKGKGMAFRKKTPPQKTRPHFHCFGHLWVNGLSMVGWFFGGGRGFVLGFVDAGRCSRSVRPRPAVCRSRSFGGRLGGGWAARRTL